MSLKIIFRYKIKFSVFLTHSPCVQQEFAEPTARLTEPDQNPICVLPPVTMHGPLIMRPLDSLSRLRDIRADRLLIYYYYFQRVCV